MPRYPLDALPSVGAAHDVPIHRDSIGAMFVGGGITVEDRPFKPYVYRGTGEDQFPETDPGWPHKNARPKAKPKRKAKRKAKPRRYTPRPVYHPAAPDRPLDIEDVRTWGNWTRARRPITTLPDISEWEEPAPPPPPKPIRPAPGWQPMSGDTLDSLLDEIGEAPVSEDEGFTATFTGTYKPCPQCRAPMVFLEGKAQSKVTFSGSPDAARITPHTEDCTATPEEVAAASNNPWGIGVFGEDCP